MHLPRKEHKKGYAGCIGNYDTNYNCPEDCNAPIPKNEDTDKDKTCRNIEGKDYCRKEVDIITYSARLLQ